MRWWKTKKCATCHEGEILLVAANVAKSQGVPVDQEKLDFWTERWVLVDAVTCTPPAAADGSVDDARDLAEWLRDRAD